MANKGKENPLQVVKDVPILVMAISTIVVFQVIKIEQSSYPMLLGRPRLQWIHTKDYWNESYITLGKPPNRVTIPILPRYESKWKSKEEESEDVLTSKYSNTSLKVEKNLDEEEEVEVYALEELPSGESKPREDTMCLTNEDIERWLSMIQYGDDVTLEEEAMFS